VSDLIDNDSAFNSSTVLGNTTNADVQAALKLKNKSSDLIRNFVDLVKKNGIIYAGHIHQHKEFVVKGREFIFIGTPY
jgi:hypothetical protein